MTNPHNPHTDKIIKHTSSLPNYKKGHQRHESLRSLHLFLSEWSTANMKYFVLGHCLFNPKSKKYDTGLFHPSSLNKFSWRKAEFLTSSEEYIKQELKSMDSFLLHEFSQCTQIFKTICASHNMRNPSPFRRGLYVYHKKLLPDGGCVKMKAFSQYAIPYSLKGTKYATTVQQLLWFAASKESGLLRFLFENIDKLIDIYNKYSREKTKMTLDQINQLGMVMNNLKIKKRGYEETPPPPINNTPPSKRQKKHIVGSFPVQL